MPEAISRRDPKTCITVYDSAPNVPWIAVFGEEMTVTDMYAHYESHGVAVGELSTPRREGNKLYQDAELSRDGQRIGIITLKY